MDMLALREMGSPAAGQALPDMAPASRPDPLADVPPTDTCGSRLRRRGQASGGNGRGLAVSRSARSPHSADLSGTDPPTLSSTRMFSGTTGILRGRHVALPQRR